MGIKNYLTDERFFREYGALRHFQNQSFFIKLSLAVTHPTIDERFVLETMVRYGIFKIKVFLSNYLVP